jgi:hypothetical protein
VSVKPEESSNLARRALQPGESNSNSNSNIPPHVITPSRITDRSDGGSCSCLFSCLSLLVFGLQLSIFNMITTSQGRKRPSTEISTDTNQQQPKQHHSSQHDELLKDVSKWIRELETVRDQMQLLSAQNSFLLDTMAMAGADFD